MHGTVPYNIFFLIYLNNVEYHLFFNRNPSAYRKRRKMRRRRIPMSNQMNQFLVTRFSFHSAVAFLHFLPIVRPNPNNNLSCFKAATCWVTPTLSPQRNSLAMGIFGVWCSGQNRSIAPLFKVDWSSFGSFDDGTRTSGYQNSLDTSSF